MTIEQLNIKLKELSDAGRFDKAIIFAANDTKDLMSERIFERLENAKGGVANSSDYSTKEIWVEPQTLPRQAGSPIGKRGKAIKTRYFKDGWAQVKREVGKPNYELTNDLASDFNSQITTIQNGICLLRLKREDNAGKVLGLNKKYGTTFVTTDEEQKFFKDSLKDLVVKEINLVL